jgi:hypothetical protein
MAVFHTYVQDNQLQGVAVPPADDRDTGGYPFSMCWLTIKLVATADEQKFVGLLP